MASCPGGQHAVHHVNSHGRILYDFLRIPHTHDVPRLVLWEYLQHGSNHVHGLGARFAHAQPANGISGKIHFYSSLSRFPTQIRVHASLDNPEEGRRSEFGNFVDCSRPRLRRDRFFSFSDHPITRSPDLPKDIHACALQNNPSTVWPSATSSP